MVGVLLPGDMNVIFPNNEHGVDGATRGLFGIFKKQSGNQKHKEQVRETFTSYVHVKLLDIENPDWKQPIV